MKQYTIEDTDSPEYEIVIPNEVVTQIIRDYREKTFYITVALAGGIIGFLLGVIA